jgi:hypothetical protein
LYKEFQSKETFLLYVFIFSYRRHKKCHYSLNTSANKLLGFLYYQFICVFPLDHASYTISYG